MLYYAILCYIILYSTLLDGGPLLTPVTRSILAVSTRGPRGRGPIHIYIYIYMHIYIYDNNNNNYYYHY